MDLLLFLLLHRQYQRRRNTTSVVCFVPMVWRMSSGFRWRIQRRSWKAHSLVLSVGTSGTDRGCHHFLLCHLCIWLPLGFYIVASFTLLHLLELERNHVQMCSLLRSSWLNTHYSRHSWTALFLWDARIKQIDWRGLVYNLKQQHLLPSKSGEFLPHGIVSKQFALMSPFSSPLLGDESIIGKDIRDFHCNSTYLKSIDWVHR